MAYAHLVRVARELTAAYPAVEIATELLHVDRGANSIPARRGLKALVAIDEVRVSVEPLVRPWVASDAAAMMVVFGRDALALAKPGSEDES